MPPDSVPIINRLYREFYNQSDLVLAQQVAPSIFRYPQRFIEEYMALRTAFPDMRFNCDMTIQQGKRVAVRWSAKGTQMGELVLPRVAVPATNRHIETMGISIFEVSNGQIIQRVWASSDGLEMLYQLGVRFVPPPPQAEPTRRTPRPR